MRRMLVLVVAVVLGAGVMALPARAGAASAPANDKPQNAKVVSSLPFSATVDTRGAVSDDVERQAVSRCGFPLDAVRKGVWYRFTPSSDLQVKISAQGSSYAAQVAVFTGTAPNFQPYLIDGAFCPFGQSWIFDLRKGTRYSILVFDAVAGSAGGTLRYSMAKALPKPTVSVSATQAVLKGVGKVRVSGTASCTGTQATLLNIFGQLSQPNVKVPVAGVYFFFLSVACGNTPISWQADVTPYPLEPAPGPTQPPPASFVTGPALLDLTASACNPDQCGEVVRQVTVMVKRP